MRWNQFSSLRIRKQPRRKPITRARLALEELESRLVPSTDITAYHQASPAAGPNPPSTINVGVNANETVLTPANVTAATFGKLYSTPVDGQVYAQPLYMESVNITTGSHQGTHNVVFVATEHDSLYAIDANTGTILWQDALLTAAHGGTVTSVPSGDVGSSDLSPEVGITATPVIDPTNNTIFVETKEKEVASDGSHYEQYLYAINLSTGAITNKVLIGDSIGDTVVSGPEVAGTGAGAVNGVVQFDALRQLDRPGLTLVNGNIYLSFASHGDNGPYHGWILGYSEASLAPTAVFNVNPNGSDDGIWQSGGTLAYETVNGNTYLYFETGNGTFDTTLTQSPFNSNLMIPSGGDYGDSFVKVEIDGSTPANGSLEATNNINGWGMHVVDYFTPSNEGNLSGGDTDLGSGAPILLPASAGSAAHPNLMVGAGKEGRIYLIDRDNMGGYHGDAAGDGNSGFDNVVQETVTGAINGSLDTPTFYNGVLYYVGGYGDEARTFTIANGVMSSSSTTQSTDSYSFPGSTPTISASGNTNAIVWDIAGPGTNQLRAYNAADGYSDEIYTSAQAANSRDSLGSAVKFTVPTVADGEVFVGTTNSVVAYGLLQQATAPPAAPTDLSATAFSGSVINLSWTDNDTAPNTASAYNILESTNGTTFTQVGTASAGATSFAVGGLQISTKYYFEVSATNSKGTSALSNIANATTTSQASTLDFSSGFAGSAGVLTYNGSAKLNGTSAELTDGGGNEAGSVFSTSAVDITKFSTQFTFQLTSAQADGFTFTIQGDGPTALGATGGGLGYQGLNNSVAVKFDLYNNNGEGTDSTGEFTDGAAPFTPAIDLSGTGIQLNSGDVFKVVMGYDGTTLNVTITDTNTNQSASQAYTVNIPQVIGTGTGYVGFTGGTGGLTAVQNVLTWTYSPTASTVPAAPSNLTGTVISGNEVDISWTDNSNNETGFLIDRSTDGGNTYSQIASVGANVTTYHDTSLSPGETVSYEVQATNAAGSSAFSNVFTATVAIPPAPPANLHTTNTTTTEVDLAWTNVATNATGIKILDAVGTNSAKVVATGLSPTTTSYHVTGLTPGTQYTFEVDSLNSSGPSGAATIELDTLPSQVTGVTATGDPGAITINWAADAGAVSYDVYRSTSSTFGSTPTWSGITATSYADSTATPGTTYFYEVSAVDPNAASPTDAAGESAKSAAVSAVAQAASGGINFGSGFAGATGITLNGGATISGSNLQLTDGGGTEARSAFDNTPQTITTFSTQFTFQITGGSNPTADGFTFTIQGVSPTALGFSGGGLGYGSDNTGGTLGIGKSLAVKFDLYSNQGEGVDSTGLYENGAAPTNVGSLDMTGSVNLHSGDVMQANLTYDGSNLTETVKDLTTGGTFTHTYTGVNILSIVGASTAYIGFTGGTGGLTAVQNIQTWTFTPGASTVAPSITTQPASQTVTAGQSVTFSVVAAGTAPLSYQWQQNGVAISGATSSSYTISSAQSANAGSYTAVVSNSAGSATSNAATLTVNSAGLPAPWADSDIGNPGVAGSASFASGTFTVNGGGSDIWNTSDQFNYVYQAVTGNETIIARVASQQNTDPWAKAGVMVRDSLNANAAYAFVHTTPGNGTDFQFRTADGASAQWNGQTNAAAPEWVELVINGTTVTGYTSPDGITWTAIGSTTLPLGGTYYVGLADTAHNNGLLSTDTFDNVNVSANATINFASGFPNTTGLTLNGTAKNVNNALQLTDTTANNEAGSAFSNSAIGVGTFSTTFTFQTTAGASTADGFAFVIQGLGATALGPSGGGLGYGPDTPGATPGIANSIAIKFDLYNNAGEGVDSTGLFTNGQSPTTGGIAPSTGSLDFTGTLDLHSGHVFSTTITYDGTTLTVKTTDTTTNASATQTYLVNIPGIVGSSSAFVGFTGGTGGLTSTQSILTWTYTG